jgi:hypothetical protein
MKNLDKKIPESFKKVGVYIIFINNKSYIGSSINIKYRINQHLNALKNNKHYNIYMQNVYNKYTLTKLDYKILEECLPEERLIKEKYWIEKLNPKLNLIKDPTTGNNCITSSKKVYQYNLKGEFIKSFISVNDAARTLNLNATTIAACCRKSCKHNKSTGNYLWSYTKVKKLNYINNSSKSRNRKVTMYTKLGKKIKTFNSIADAARELMTKNDSFDSLCANISKVASSTNYSLKDKYLFSYEDKDIIENTSKRKYPIIQITLTGEKIYWNSTVEASKALNININGINRVISGNRKTYKNSKWICARVKQGELLETLNM